MNWEKKRLLQNTEQVFWKPLSSAFHTCKILNTEKYRHVKSQLGTTAPKKKKKKNWVHSSHCPGWWISFGWTNEIIFWEQWNFLDNLSLLDHLQFGEKNNKTFWDKKCHFDLNQTKIEVSFQHFSRQKKETKEITVYTWIHKIFTLQPDALSVARTVNLEKEALYFLITKYRI